MRETNYLSMQANIICLLLALIGSSTIVKHPDWFGGVPDAVVHGEGAATPATSFPVAFGQLGSRHTKLDCDASLCSEVNKTGTNRRLSPYPVTFSEHSLTPAP
jgi:hypothetical protein